MIPFFPNMGISEKGEEIMSFQPDVSSSLLQEREEASGLHNIFNTSIVPYDVGSIILLEYGDGFPIVDKLLFISIDTC